MPSEYSSWCANARKFCAIISKNLKIAVYEGVSQTVLEKKNPHVIQLVKKLLENTTMKIFNLVKEIIVVDRMTLMQAVNSAKTFAITYRGNVKYAPFEPSDIFIYQGVIKRPASSALIPPKPLKLSELFGIHYKVVEDDDRILIKAAGAWQDLLPINTPNAEYDDTTGDGIAEFSHKELENIGWHATEFNITYRELSEVLEKEAEGILFCIEYEGDNYQFSGLGYLQNIEEAYQILYKYSKERIEKLIESDKDFAKENLTEDEEEAAKFFKVL